MAKSTYTTFASQTFTAKLDRDHKRATDARRKYAYGTTIGPGSTRPKPAHAQRSGWFTAEGLTQYIPIRDRMHEMKHRSQTQAQEASELTRETRFGNHADYVEAAYPVEAGTRDELQDDCIYSYDHPTGPSTGSNVLGAAIDRAVERFENKVTETLVKDEYSVVDETEAADERQPEHDEDFEFV